MWRRVLFVAVMAMATAIAAVPAATHWRRLTAEPAGWIGQSIDCRTGDCQTIDKVATQAVKGETGSGETGDARNGINLHYEIRLPARVEPGMRYPVVLYLHQLDMGNDRVGLLRQVDAWFNTADFRTRHPAIIVVPMLDQTKDPGGRLINFGGKRDGHLGEEATVAALKRVMARYPVDPDRIYVTGNSMGGMGTWALLLSYNARSGSQRIFAAGMPLAGRHATADPEAAARALRQVPIWAIHGARDPEVSPTWDRTMAGLLAGSSTFRYTEDPALEHDVWDRYYTRSDVWDWLFAQRGGALARAFTGSDPLAPAEYR